MASHCSSFNRDFLCLFSPLPQGLQAVTAVSAFVATNAFQSTDSVSHKYVHVIIAAGNGSLH